LADVEDIHADLDNVDAHITNVDNHIATEFAAVSTQLTNVDAHITNEFAALDAHLVTLVNQLAGQLTGATDLLSADLRQVMKLELTPNGQKAILPAILTCTGTDCPNVLSNCPKGMCSWNNVGPLP
jgi:hypothetical protein